MPEAKHNLDKIRHSTSHLLAYAVKEIFGDVKFAIGPTIDEGFYYDFDLGRETFSTDDLEKIEKKMAELIKQKLKFTKTETTIKEALKKTTDQPYKQELIKELQKEAGVQLENKKKPKLSYFGSRIILDAINDEGLRRLDKKLETISRKILENLLMARKVFYRN